MTGDTRDVPDIQTQISTITQLSKKKLEVGDTWYLIEINWYRKWENYATYTSYTDDAPGPVDNSIIFEITGDGQRALKEQLIDVVDYHLVPEEAWEKLTSWYGEVDHDTAIPRTVVEDGHYSTNRNVEVYLMELKLCTNSDLNKVTKHKFSRKSRIAQVREQVMKLLEIPENKETKLWSKNAMNNFEKITKDEDTLEDAGICIGNMLVIEVQNDDSSWTRPDIPMDSSCSSSGTIFPTHPNSPPRTRSTAMYNSLSSSSSSQQASSSFNSSHRYDHQRQRYTKGVCGLHNLGNTCFMNSALQCMSNVEALTNYFSENRHKKEINTDNPLGMRGEIAKAYGELIQQMWSGIHQAVMARDFKSAVGKFAPQFCGFQQHDSQELLAFLLDGLHEDLNRIKRKPYIQVKDANGRPDKEVADEAWVNHKKRNDSIIVDMFHGLFKSTVICPECEKISITFDPFCFLSLPMVIKKDRTIEFFFYSKETTSRPLHSCVNVLKQSRISSLCDEVGNMLSVPSNHLIVAEVYTSKINRVFSSHDSVDTIKDHTLIYIFDVGARTNTDQTVAVCLRRPVNKQSVTNYDHRQTMDIFSTPFILNVNRETNFQDLYNIMLNKMSRFLTIPKTNDWMEKDDSTNSNNIDVTGDATDNNYNTDRIGETTSVGSSSPVVNSQRIVRMFTLSRYNPSHIHDARPIRDDGKQFEIGSDRVTYMSIDWNPVALSKFYIADEATSVEKHISYEKQMRSSEPKKSTLDLDQCIKLFLRIEKLGAEDPWFCPKCKAHQQATKKFDLWTLPDMLVICLKRFRYNRYWRDKIDSTVHYPIRNLDMSEYVLGPGKESYMYDLIAVSNHYGSLGGGHYTAYAKNHADGHWYNFDDSRVSQVSEDQVVSKAAYVLLYRRQGSKVKPESPAQTISSLATLSTDNSHNHDAPSSNGQSSGSDQEENMDVN